jgi:hypothetical protein
VDALTKAAFDHARRLLNEHAQATAAKAASLTSAVSGKHVSGAPAVAAVIRGYADRILGAAEVLAAGTVCGASLRLDGVQPIPRVDVRVTVAGKARKVRTGPGNMLHDVFETVHGLAPDRSMREAMDAVEPALRALLAGVRADAANAVQKALADDRITRPIRERLEKKRALARQNALDATRHHFRNYREILTEDDVMQLWREGLVGEVMES